jgi:hypothetical protein
MKFFPLDDRTKTKPDPEAVRYSWYRSWLTEQEMYEAGVRSHLAGIERIREQIANPDRPPHMKWQDERDLVTATEGLAHCQRSVDFAKAKVKLYA